MGIKRQIFEALATELSGISWVKVVNWKKIWLLDSDFNDYQIPAIQIYDTGTRNEHQGGRIQATMALSVELVLKQTSAGVVSQADLFDKVEEIESVIGANINLGINGMLHLRYIGDVTDLHTVDPYYIARLDFEAIYLKSFTGC